MDKREDSVWFLNPGVTPGALITGKIPHRRITRDSQEVGHSLCQLFLRVEKLAIYEQYPVWSESALVKGLSTKIRER